jgi:predicted nucleic acid-binding protein
MQKRDLRLFLDSNVILSSMLSQSGSPKILLDLLSIRVPLIRGFTGRYNLDEIERNLKKKFPHLLAVYRKATPKMNLEILPVPDLKRVAPLISKMSPKDAPVLASAQMGEVDYIVTGDKKGFPKEVAAPIKVINPTDCVTKLIPKIIRNSED